MVAKHIYEGSAETCRHFQVKTLGVCEGGEGPDDAEDFVQCIACGATGFRFIGGTIGVMMTNEKKVDAYLDYHNGPEVPDGTVYRTAAVVEEEPCGSCVRDATRPNNRTGYPDPISPMMMRCDACGARWIDPTLEEQARTAQHHLDNMSKQAEMMQSMADRMIEETFRTRRYLRYQIAAAVIGGTLLADRIIRIFFP